MSIVFYRRPDYIAHPDGPLNKAECAEYVEKYKHLQGRTPPELSFDNVIEDKALPPCTLNDFMDYLIYVERNAENLQFFLWLRDYTMRFEALPENEQRLSPEWIETDYPPSGFVSGSASRTASCQTVGSSPNSKDIEVDWKVEHEAVHWNARSNLDAISFATAHQSPVQFRAPGFSTEGANAKIGLEWDGFSVQPFRKEITRVIAHYIVPGSPRELNLSHKDRVTVLRALQNTTHPSAFESIRELVEPILRGQAHPNFVRWSVCNGNKPKVLFVRTMGTVMVILGLVAMTLLILSRASRWYRIIPCVLLWLGATNLVASKKGMCMILTLNHQRDLKPWELDADPVSTFGLICKPIIGASDPASKEAGLVVSVVESETSFRKPDDDEMTIGEKGMRHWTLNSFGDNNAWDHEDWVDRYAKRSLLRRAFPGSTWVQATGIRQLQSHIVRESQLWGLLITVVIVASFTAIPNGNFF